MLGLDIKESLSLENISWLHLNSERTELSSEWVWAAAVLSNPTGELWPVGPNPVESCLSGPFRTHPGHLGNDICLSFAEVTFSFSFCLRSGFPITCRQNGPMRKASQSDRTQGRRWGSERCTPSSENTRWKIRRKVPLEPRRRKCPSSAPPHSHCLQYL